MGPADERSAESADGAAEARGLLAEFDGADALVAAVRRARAAGYSQLEAYTPFAVDELPEALGLRPTRLRAAMLIGAVVGALAGLAMQYWSAVHAYPIDSGGRPLASWPAFVPVTFELAILFGAFAGFGSLLIGAGLPRPHHPVFAVPGFERATRDRFFLEIGADDPRFDATAVRAFLGSLGPRTIEEMP